MLRLKKSIFPHKTASLYHLPARTYELQALTCSVQARTQELTSLVFTRFCLESSSTWLWNLAPVTGQVKSPSLATVNLEFTNGGTLWSLVLSLPAASGPPPRVAKLCPLYTEQVPKTHDFCQITFMIQEIHGQSTIHFIYYDRLYTFLNFYFLKSIFAPKHYVCTHTTRLCYSHLITT